MLDQWKCFTNSKLDNLFCVYFRPSTSTTVFAKLFLLFYTVHPVVDSLVEQFYANVNTSLFKFVIGFGENGFLFNIREADARIFIWSKIPAYSEIFVIYYDSSAATVRPNKSSGWFSCFKSVLFSFLVETNLTFCQKKLVLRTNKCSEHKKNTTNDPCLYSCQTCKALGK